MNLANHDPIYYIDECWIYQISSRIYRQGISILFLEYIEQVN